MKKAASEIVEVCRKLHALGFLAAADGNVSVRVSETEILLTPTGRSKALISPEEMATITLAGDTLVGRPSGEKPMHLSVYRKCPTAKAVVHAHPPTAIALSIAKPEWKELPGEALSELILACGRIPFVPYARPGTKAMGDSLESFLPEHRILILSRHGALCWGETLEEAYLGMERLEHTCLILSKALMMGGITALPQEEVEHLRAERRKMGPRIL